jgi:hypothetical protein
LAIAHRLLRTLTLMDSVTPRHLGELEQLGTVDVPSGRLIVLDFGLLRLWSGNRPPLLRQDDAPPNIVLKANQSVDLVVVGPDAAAASRLIELASARGPYVFDYPPDEVAHLRNRLVATWDEHRLKADLEQVHPRMPHAARARILLESSPSGTEVPFHGIWATALAGLPTDRSMPVLGQRMDPDGPDADRWWSVWLAIEPGKAVSRSVEVGYVLVDEARLLFADLDALGAFRSDETLDGRADIAFWGKDAVDAANRVGAGALPEGDGMSVFGWRDIPIEDVASRTRLLEELERSEGLRFRVDVRPHDHHFELLAQARSSPQGSGTIGIGGAAMCGFFTSWGDGAFPVYRDLAGDGTLVRVRVELGSAEIVRRARALDERWFGTFAKAAIVSAKVIREGEEVRYLHREQPDHEDDSGWRIFAGDETQDYLDDPNNAAVVPLRDVLERDPSLEEILRTPQPCAFERSGGGRFERVAAPHYDERRPNA